MTLDDLVEVPPFSILDEDLARALREEAREVPAPEGTEVLRQDEVPDGLYVVLEGALQSLWRDPDNGLLFLGARRVEGEALGLAEVLLARPSRWSLRADRETRLAWIPADSLQALCSDDPRIAAMLMRQVAERLHAEAVPGRSPVVDLSRVMLDETLWGLLPLGQWRKYRALPLARNGRVLVVGFVDPGDLQAIDDLSRLLPAWQIRPVALDRGEFDRFLRARVVPALERMRPEDANRDRWFQSVSGKTFEVSLVEILPGQTSEDRSRSVSGEQVVALVNRLIGEALDLSASDIHVEPSEQEMTVRYRVDGRLKKRPEPLDMRFHAPLVSRLKALGRMDIAEKRRAQDGRLTIQHGRRTIDFRLATVSTRFGEKIVLRILDPQTILIDLERLIPYEPVYRAIAGMLDQPQGLVIVAGPTGSGKTTTVYSALLRLRQDEINIVTIEDPIEYTVEGVTQVQVNHGAGINFATAVRHFLRQDPDVIVVGETRDSETAATTVEAALTGHLVFTTLHANDALGTVIRLREMGVDPFLLAHTLIGVVSQRLVRRSCPHCRQPVVYHPDLIRPLGIFPPEEGQGGFTFLKGSGCALCNYQGYKGRVGVFEALRIEDRLRPMLTGASAMSAVEEAALATGGLLPLREHCRHLLVNGITTPEEIARVLFTTR
ncbi:Flp pilus assembly complex ATPase component TadA [Myxococcota bacterium]|nr:Flp pilus assembly complex ATPase component TadA [Myxococcota bacterium]